MLFIIGVVIWFIILEFVFEFIMIGNKLIIIVVIVINIG